MPQGAWPTGPAGKGPRVGLVPLYPMGLGDILDASFRILRAAALPSTLIVLLVLGPLQVLASAGFQSPFTMLSDPVPQFVPGELILLAALGTIGMVVLTPLAVAAMTWLGAHATEQSAPTWREALRAGARRYWATLGAFVLIFLMMAGVGAVAAGVIAGLVAAGSLPLGILMGIVLVPAALVLLLGLYILGFLTVPCIVVEGRGPVQGIGRAWRLLRARFWPTIGISFVVGLVVLLLGTAVSSVVSIPAFFVGSAAWVFIALGSLLDQLIRVPLGSYAALAIHVDQRIRTEGYDVAVLVSDLQR